ncbi:MAG: major capsid protein [Phycisphaerae bacterium]
MALTLLDMQRLRKDPFEKGVLDVFMAECDISKVLPIKTIGTVEVSRRRNNGLPTLGWRKRGEAFPAVAGTTSDTVTDQVFAMGATIDIDKTDMRDKNLIEDPLAERTKAAVKAAAWTFNDAVINGDHATDEDMPEGLKVRIAAGPSAQIIYANSSTASLDVSPASGPTTAELYTWLDKIDEAIYACDGHQADICLTDADFIRAYKSALRRLSLYKDVPMEKPYTNPSGMRSTGSDFYNKSIFEYNGVKFFDMGLKVDQSTHIVGTETVGDACRPAYFVKMGDDYFHGIQQYALEVSKSFMLDDGVTYRTTIDWPVGFRHVHPASFSKLSGSKVA